MKKYKLQQKNIENIINRIVEYSKNSVDEATEKRDMLFIGKILAYHEVIDIFQKEMINNNIDLEYYGLNIDLYKVL
ncbi:MAG: hypothetical protein ACI4VF_09640 [Lachnospirales bacterium]